MLSLFVGFALSIVYAVDLGTQNVRMASSSPGKPVEIKTNERDQRMTPNYVAFPLSDPIDDPTHVKWIVGPDAERIAMRNKSHGIANPTGQLWHPDRKGLNDLPIVYTAGIALYQHLKGLKMKLDRVTLLVPSYASPQYRQLLLLTTKLVGIKQANILDSATAVGTLYSVEKIKKGSRKPTTILFVDIGAENVDAYLWKFRPLGEKLFMELLQYRHEGGIGGNYVDEMLLEWAKSKIGRPLVGSEPYIVLSHLRKAKERLSNIRSIDVDLNEDYGMFLTITQELIKEMTANMTTRITAMFKDMIDPDEIELVGGSSRLQVFIDAVTEAFPEIPIRRSLNSDEAAAIGGAYYTALKTGTIIGAKIEVKKPCLLGLDTTFDGVKHAVFQPGDIIKDKKFKMRGNESRMIQNTLGPVENAYEEVKVNSEDFNATDKNFNSILIEGMKQAMRSLDGILTNGTTPTYSLKYGLSQDLDCADLTDVVMVANITVETRKKALRGHGKTNFKEIKMPVISIPTDMKFRIPPNATEFMQQIAKADEGRRKREESCHKYETFIIDTRDQAEFDNDMKAVTTPEEREELIEQLDKARSTIDCTMLTNETAYELDDKLEKLRKKFEKLLERYEELQQRPNALRKLQVAISRGKEAKKKAICDEETMESYNKYVKETKEKLEKLKKDGPLDQPSFLVKDIKEREKEILNKMAELRRPPKKKEVINYNSADEENLDEDEIDRLKNCGIMVGNKGKNKKRKVDEDPVIKAQKEAKLKDLETRYNASRKAWNATKAKYCSERKQFEMEHMIPNQPCEFPDEKVERHRFRDLENYIEKKERKRKAKEDRIAEEKRIAEEMLRKIEEEKNRPPTPTPTAEEAEKIRIKEEEEARVKKFYDDARKAIEEERRAFREASIGMFDEEELNKADEDAMYEKFKEMRKKFKHESHRPFANDDERERYEEEKREYESLRKRFENDPVRKKAEQKKKREARMRREAKEAKERNMTKLDEKIQDAEADLRRLVRDEKELQEDIADFEKLKVQIIRREEHDHRKLRRIKKRDLLERKARRDEWDEWSRTRREDLDLKEDSDRPLPGDTHENLELQLADYDDVDLDYESSFYDKFDDRGVDDTDEWSNEKGIFDEESEETSSSSDGSVMKWEKRRTERRIQHNLRNRAMQRTAVNPELANELGFEAIEWREYLKSISTSDKGKRLAKGRRDPRANPKALYEQRFANNEDHEDHEIRKRGRHDPAPRNDDDFMIDVRDDIQEEELAEDEL